VDTLIRGVFHRHLLVNGLMGRWPDFSQACQGDFILLPGRFQLMALKIQSECVATIRRMAVLPGSGRRPD
jgi:hypothetical protein